MLNLDAARKFLMVSSGEALGAVGRPLDTKRLPHFRTSFARFSNSIAI